MHHDCVRYYAESQALLVSIFAPHWADYIWRDVLLKASQSSHKTSNAILVYFPPRSELC